MIRLARHLLPLAGDRLACAIQFFGLAMMLSAANVVLGTIASAVFLAERGPDELRCSTLLSPRSRSRSRPPSRW